jgi:hypothetical protein
MSDLKYESKIEQDRRVLRACLNQAELAAQAKADAERVADAIVGTQTAEHVTMWTAHGIAMHSNRVEEIA